MTIKNTDLMPSNKLLLLDTTGKYYAYYELEIQGVPYEYDGYILLKKGKRVMKKDLHEYDD